MGLKLGDTLTINVLGRDITATISSFREVDFSTAGMGFILSMNPAAIAAAPHSFIATVYAGTGAPCVERAVEIVAVQIVGATATLQYVHSQVAVDQITTTPSDEMIANLQGFDLRVGR